MKSARYCLVIGSTWLLITFGANAQKLPYQNRNLPVEKRVTDLLARMTVEEKFWQLYMVPVPMDISDAELARYQAGVFGFQVSAASAGGEAHQQMLTHQPGVNARTLTRRINAIQRYVVTHTRLGIPIIPFDEALHGLVREEATAFPQAIGLAATFDTTLMRRVAGMIARETKARGIRQVLSPVVNVATDVRWGRVEETYGEDPFLVSAMGAAFVRAFESQGIVTTPKHFIANTGDGGRDSYPVHADKRYLEAIHFPPFRAALRAGARSLMTSYNSVNGVPMSANHELLLNELKGTWGFRGFVISDAGATGGSVVLHHTAQDYPDATQQAINNGLDVIFQTSYDHHGLFMPAFTDGRIARKRMDDAVARVLRAKFELGLFDNPYTDESLLDTVLADQQRKALAREAARSSLVLLKNQNHVLPLSGGKTLAVIGTDAVEARLGGYSGPGNGVVTILDGIRAQAGAERVLYAHGCGRSADVWTVIPPSALQCNGAPGLCGEYYDGLTMTGPPVAVRRDARIDFQWTFMPPIEKIPTSFYSVRWTGELHVPATGEYSLAIEGNDGFRLYVDDVCVIDQWDKQSYHRRSVTRTLTAGQSYPIRIEFREPVGNARIRFLWKTAAADSSQRLIDEAVATAREADYAVVVAGIEEGEFQDRALLSLPGEQEELIRAIARTGKPVVVVLVGGSAIRMDQWIDSVDAVLMAWYPGEEGGNAVADVLLGAYNPAGRLPITFPQHEGQLPLVYNHWPTGRGDDYHNLSGLPLFPFGYGLSYTTFAYATARLDRAVIHAGESTTLHCTITNTGTVDGDEVVQLYIRDVLASVAQPVLSLQGFQRIHLKAGESRTISFAITPAMLALAGSSDKPEPGTFQLMVGASSRDIRLQTKLEVTR